VSLALGSDGPERVAAGRLDLDHVGAEVGEHGADLGRGEHVEISSTVRPDSACGLLAS